jgi:hypothetical protein
MKRFVWLAFFAVAGFAAMYAQNRPVKPAWVERPSAVYPDWLYVSAVGAGADRQTAEQNAAAALTSFFKQSVTSRVSISESERRVNGAYFHEAGLTQSVEASAALDKLIGAEIRETWNDSLNGVWYAVSVMEKSRCSGLYEAELDKTLREASALIAMPDGVTFEAVSRCGRARELTAKADTYALVLSLLGGRDRHDEISGLSAGVNAALERAKAIPVDVRVSGDSNGRVKAAFSGAFAAEGFTTGGRGSRFALEASFSTSPAPKTAYFNTRYTVDAALIDTGTGAELFTFNVSNRESHPASQEYADNRALLGAVKKITEKFPAALNEYLSLSY